MTDRPALVSVPATRERITLLQVDRAVSDLRRGGMVALQGGNGEAALMLAAEAVSEEILADSVQVAGAGPVLAITARRAAALGAGRVALGVMTLSVDEGLTAKRVRELSDPLSDLTIPPPYEVSAAPAEPHSCNSAAIKLAKIARLLPAAVTAEIRDPSADDLTAWAARHDILLVDVGDVFQYEPVAARSLRLVSRARVPLTDAQETEIIAFRPRDGGLEHLAVVVGKPDSSQPILVRLHSECFTGDLLSSLRCDCGDQLRSAIREIAQSGGGILLYLAQEGRGIGLVNKLRAYSLQDRGFDTVDANEQLGFDADERVYLPAAVILRQLGYERVRLLTNNPTKVSGLMRCGISVVERVSHTMPANPHNEGYVRTKAERFGHLF